MTPKEKAIELIEKFAKYSYTKKIDAKQCVLICVDEILLQCEDANFGGFSLYWQAVKQEIEKL